MYDSWVYNEGAVTFTFFAVRLIVILSTTLHLKYLMRDEVFIGKFYWFAVVRMNHIRSLYPDGYYAMVISHITDNWQQNDRPLSNERKKG